MKYYLIPLLVLFILSCSSPTEIDDETISTISTTNSIIIYSHANTTVFLFVVEQEIAAQINWDPGFSEPKIAPKGSKIILFDEIFSGSQKTVNVGDKVVIYYWDNSKEENPTVYSKVLKL